MPVLDWSATAAWTAVIISVTGTVVGPIVTAIITNRHQIKLRNLDIQQKAFEKYLDHRNETINSFLSKVGTCLAYADVFSLKNCGDVYHNIYQYVPEDFWPELDSLFNFINGDNWEKAIPLYETIVHRLSAILKETPKIPS